MTRWKITIEYDGTGFCGWQRQDGVLSIQQTIEDAIQKFSGETVRLHVAGRTDSKVHARAQIAHFDLNKTIDAYVVRDAINFHVRPHKITILLAEEVPETFHARFNAIERSYRFHIINRRAPLAMYADYAWHVSKPLDVELMQRAANLLIGKHDFSTFRAQNCQSNSPIRTMEKLSLKREDESIMIDTSARSFLYHQVRNMVGTLCMVGMGKWTLEEFQTAFLACDRTKGGPTAPAHGLCFWSVTYP